MSSHECPYRRQKHDGFKIIRKNCARGVHGNISVIRSKSDIENGINEEFIWKRPVNKSRKHLESLKKEIEKSKKWRDYGLSKVNICWHSDKRSLIKTLIRGHTLKQILHNHPHFFSNTHNRANIELGNFVKRLVDNRHYIQDCNRSNLVYDREDHKWNIIDSGPIQKKRSKSETSSRFKQTFLRSWGSSLSDNEKEALKEFLNKYCK